MTELQLRTGAATPAESKGPGTPTPAVRKARVLVVDDNPVNRILLSTRLRKAGHQVEAVDGGEAAVAIAGAARHDIILMDVRMPGMDGLAATRAIRDMPGPAARVRIVGVSADGYSGAPGAWRQDGFDAFLLKPVDWQALDAEIDRALSP